MNLIVYYPFWRLAVSKESFQGEMFIPAVVVQFDLSTP